MMESESAFIAGWLLVGITGFFMARAAWSLEFGRKPVTVGMLLLMLLAMWVPPLSLLAAMVWSLSWLVTSSSASGSVVERIWHTEIVSLWKRRRAE